MRRYVLEKAVAKTKFHLDLGKADARIRLSNRGKLLGRLWIKPGQIEWKQRGFAPRILKIRARTLGSLRAERLLALRQAKKKPK
jgi:hypothetical protein